MANFGLYTKPYIKMGTNQTVCYCCVKDECERTGRNVHDVTYDQYGKHEHKMVFYIRRSGQDTCICLDCFKKIYEQIVSEEIKDEKGNVEAPAVTPVVETPEEAATNEGVEKEAEAKPTAKKNNKTK